MNLLSEFTLDKIKEIRESLISEYIGDWNKPHSYYVHLALLDAEIKRRIE